MKVHVEYTAQLRMRVGCAGDVFELGEAATTTALLRAIADRYGAEVRALLLDEDGQPSPTVLCFVGSEQADGERVLSDAAQVTLMTPISGG